MLTDLSFVNQGSKRNSKQRQEEPQSETFNFLSDPRIIRGNTYSANILSKSLKENLKNQRTISPIKFKKRQIPARRWNTPPPVDGRLNITIQTDTFLEELSDRPIEKHFGTQTDAFIDRPPSPLYIPKKLGVDVETQIIPGELFDFDLEVEPILEVIVGKTLESAMLELMQEEEIEAIRKQQLEYETLRDAELAEVKRLEAEILRKQREKDRRVAQAKQQQVDRLELNQKIAAKKFAQKVVEDMQIELFKELEREGYFYDPLAKEIEEVYLPELLHGLQYNMDCYYAAEAVSMEILENVLVQARAMEEEAKEERHLRDIELQLEQQAKEEARLREIELKRLIEEEQKLRDAEIENAAREAELNEEDGE